MAETSLEQKIKKAKQELDGFTLVGDSETGQYLVNGQEIGYYQWLTAKGKAQEKLNKLIGASGGIENINRLIAGIESTNNRLNASITKGTVKGRTVVLSTQQTIEQNKARIAVLRSVGQQFAETPEQSVVAPRISTVTPEDVATPSQTKQGPPAGPYSPAMLKAAKNYVDKGLSGPLDPTTAYLVQEYIASKKPGSTITLFDSPTTGRTNKKVGDGGPTRPGAAQGDTTVKNGVTYTWNGTNWVKAGAVPFNKIEETFRKMFPSQAWLLDLDRAKYPKLFELIQRGVSGRMYETQQGLERFAAELKNTDFYTELATTDKIRQIKAVTGDLGFEGSNFNKFLTTSMNMGWEGDTLKAETYKEVFRRDDAGNYINPVSVTRAKKSNEYLKVANVGKAYFNTISDATIESRLTGVLNDEDIQRQQRELAKTKYAHLGGLIDQGFTLADLSSGFKQQAAQLLEKDENAIDMSQADFEVAYNFGEPGQKRMMTNGEWEIMLRSNAKFGWDKTNNAKAEARQLASTISQAFGKVI